MKKLKTLEEHNTAYYVYYQDLPPQLNGISCPNCGDELYDSQPNEILTSNPPKKNIKCYNEDCGYFGYRIV